MDHFERSHSGKIRLRECLDECKKLHDDQYAQEGQNAAMQNKPTVTGCDM
jgi:hypothetical protein